MGAGLALIAVGVWLMMKKSKIEAEIYKGTIVGLTKFNKYYIVRFECDGEITIEGGLLNSEDKVGEEIEIEYNKEQPEVCSIKGANRGYILIIAGIIFILIRAM
ncbi:hypothetical protein DXA30_00480 [Fusobacterium ulcerans]|jgi:hypothetical protein|uniref:hypothetical protein n=1 Tax=Fusobacterium ulcerans TaxID=861 RepID=UPI000E50DDA5|nr:hypothetical protein [Fusobacterium ulcerans]RGY67078.1 hypothetical protein DXA30_00480 [Fusobacterium ulcerans]